MICDFVCNMCGKQFKSQKTLTQHNRDVHIEEDIPCSLCDKTFRMKKHLAYHKFSKHTEKESLQCDIDCIYMTSLHCVFTLSVFGCVEPLKKISGWVFLLNGLGLFRTTLCACRSFWGGAENCSLTGKLLWPAHLFCHFGRRVLSGFFILHLRATLYIVHSLLLKIDHLILKGCYYLVDR